MVKTVVEYSLGLFISFYSKMSIFIKRGENYNTIYIDCLLISHKKQ